MTTIKFSTAARTVPYEIHRYGRLVRFVCPDRLSTSRRVPVDRAQPGPLLTTDYVIDETLTLMRSRGQPDVALEFGDDVFAGRLANVHYLTPAEIAAAWEVFRTFADKGWSFTDCTSKVVIETLGIPTAFAFDQHFRQFGTVTVVP